MIGWWLFFEMGVGVVVMIFLMFVGLLDMFSCSVCVSVSLCCVVRIS